MYPVFKESNTMCEEDIADLFDLLLENDYTLNGKPSEIELNNYFVEYAPDIAKSVLKRMLKLTKDNPEVLLSGTEDYLNLD